MTPETLDELEELLKHTSWRDELTDEEAADLIAAARREVVFRKALGQCADWFDAHEWHVTASDIRRILLSEVPTA